MYNKENETMNNRPPEETSMPLSDQAYSKKKERNAKYAAEHTTRVVVNLNHNTDQDILSYLNTIQNKQGLIKALLRTRMEDEGYTYGTETEAVD